MDTLEVLQLGPLQHPRTGRPLEISIGRYSAEGSHPKNQYLAFRVDDNLLYVWVPQDSINTVDGASYVLGTELIVDVRYEGYDCPQRWIRDILYVAREPGPLSPETVMVYTSRLW